jgi:DNA modification methylase
MMELNKIYNENCIETMARMPDGFIDLTLTSPPYDNIRKYNGYSFDFESIAKELYRVTKIGGVVVWVVGDATINGSETGTSFKQALFFKECGFNLHDTMIYKQPGTGAKGSNLAYWQCFEYMFVLSKGKPKTVNRIRDKRNIKMGTICTSNKQHREGVGTRKHPEAGTVVSEIGIRENIWEIANGNGHGDYTGHPAPFPEKLARDHIKSWSNENDIVYDCFGGSGTTAKMAHLLLRNWVLSEISEEYCKLAENRLDPYLRQTKLF